MILYLDTSALIKLYAEESGSEEVRKAVGEARVVAISEIGYVEARSALARKERERSFSTQEHDEAMEQLNLDFQEVYLLRGLTGRVIAHTGELAREQALRAYDAVHLATALALREEAREISLRRRESGGPGNEESNELRVLMMGYDSSLTEAARAENLAYDPESSPSPHGENK